MLELIKQAKIGSVIPLYKELDEEINAFEYFAKLSNHGRKKNSIFFEDNEKSFGTINPCLVLSGKDSNFEIRALNDTGKKFLAFIKNELKFCDKINYSKDRIQGTLKPVRRAVAEDQRIKLKTHMDIIRSVAFAFKPNEKNPLSCFLFGIVSYDFVNNVEDMPKNAEDLNDPDYLLYFIDNLFLVEHKTKKTFFAANALITDNKKEQVYGQCNKAIRNYEKVLESKLPKPGKFKKKEFKVNYDTGREEFLGMIKELKKNIVDSNILHAVPSRLVRCNYNSEPLDMFSSIKKLSNNMSYYAHDDFGASIGYGSGSSFRISGENEKRVNLRIVSATKPRGKLKDSVDNDLDDKYETLLRVNQNKTIKHIMLLDAARNEVAKICNPGQRNVQRLFAVEKKEKSQSLVSDVSGILRKDFDALYAYLSTINFDLSGLPKVKAIELLRKLEKTSRGFYSGSLVSISADGSFDSSTIENFRLKKDAIYFRASSFVLHNTNDDTEIKDNEARIASILQIIKSTGGLK